MTGYVYFLTNISKSNIYIGVTSNLVKRVWEHREGVADGFTKRYQLKSLVYYEVYDDIKTAILYEKKLKNISRAKKDAIVNRMNPEWEDLYHSIL